MPLSKRSRRGAFWLLVISGITAILPRVIMTWNEGEFQEPIISHQEFAALSEVILAENDEREKDRYASYEKKYNAPPQRFDPNQYTREDWIKLGLSAKQADVILKFSKRGLYSNDDLKRIFVIPEELFLLVKDSTYYPERRANAYTNFAAAKEKVWVDLNTANKDELMKIPGIGAYFADKIVFYREKLGGYVDVQQLLEIRKFDAQKLEDIEMYIYLGSEPVHQLDVNAADFESLNAHPYISYDVANSIVKMRAQKAFQHVADIKRSKLIDDALFDKLLPYLTIQ